MYALLFLRAHPAHRYDVQNDAHKNHKNRICSGVADLLGGKRRRGLRFVLESLGIASAHSAQMLGYWFLCLRSAKANHSCFDLVRFQSL